MIWPRVVSHKDLDLRQNYAKEKEVNERGGDVGVGVDLLGANKMSY